jgi:hypothetical protein
MITNDCRVTYHVASVVERDKRDSTLVVAGLLDPSNQAAFGIGKVVLLCIVVCGSVHGGQVGHDGFNTDRVDDCLFSYDRNATE